MRIGIALLLLRIFVNVAHAEPVADILTRGTMTQAQTDLAALLERDKSADADQIHFAIGIAQFLGSIETMANSFYQFGLRHDQISAALPFLRLPVDANPEPAKISYDNFRNIFQTFVADMDRTRQTLEQIKQVDHIKLSVPISQIHLDFNGDGKADDEERLSSIIDALSHRATTEPAQDLTINFDAGDVPWLIGYTHLLSAAAEMVLAYDEQRLFDVTAHLFFTKVKSPYDFENARKVFGFSQDNIDVADIVAFVHLLNFQVKEPQRLASALCHLQAMVQQSRKSWGLILKETDDEHEWIPNPNQHAAINGVTVSAERVQAWRQFLDEFDSILSGKKLIPFWRATEPGQGVNLNHFFTRPEPFDLVLAIQGAGAIKFVEKGNLTDPDFWKRLDQTFNRNFLPFAVWFN